MYINNIFISTVEPTRGSRNQRCLRVQACEWMCDCFKCFADHLAYGIEFIVQTSSKRHLSLH